VIGPSGTVVMVPPYCGLSDGTVVVETGVDVVTGGVVVGDGPVVVDGPVAQADTTRAATIRHPDNTVAFIFILFAPST